MTGILVHGSNHFIVRGPLPDRAASLALARHWSLIQITVPEDGPAATANASLRGWSIITREFRENLAWAVVVPGDGEISSAVRELLGELSARCIAIHDASVSDW
jgi:hypothetical protein